MHDGALQTATIATKNQGDSLLDRLARVNYVARRALGWLPASGVFVVESPKEVAGWLLENGRAGSRLASAAEFHDEVADTVRRIRSRWPIEELPKRCAPRPCLRGGIGCGAGHMVVSYQDASPSVVCNGCGWRPDDVEEYALSADGHADVGLEPAGVAALEGAAAAIDPEPAPAPVPLDPVNHRHYVLVMEPDGFAATCTCGHTTTPIRIDTSAARLDWINHTNGETP